MGTFNECRINSQLYKAAEFLAEYLANGEKASAEVFETAAEYGISEQTLKRSKRIIGVISRKSGGRWYMSAPNGLTEHFPDCAKARKTQYTANARLKLTRIGAVSSDWVSVNVNSVDDNRYSAEKHRVCKNVADSHLRIKIGAYEIETDARFPVKKLIKLLRAMARTSVYPSSKADETQGGDALC